MGVEPGIAALVQVLAVIGRVDQRRRREVRPLEQSIEERADVPEQGVAIGVAVAPPVLARAAETFAVARVAHIFMLRSEEHTSELQSLMRTSYAVFCLKTKKRT